MNSAYERRSMRGTFCKVSALLIALLVAAGSASAALVADQTFLYNFDNGQVLSTSGLNGQDNWSGTDGSVVITTATSIHPDISGNYLQSTGNPQGTHARANNGFFSFAIPDNAPRFDLEFDVTRGNSGTTEPTAAKFGLADGGSTLLSFGVFEATGARPRWGIASPSGTVRDTKKQEDGYPAYSGGGSNNKHVRLEVDMSVAGGQASFFVTGFATGNPAGEVAVAALQNIGLNLGPLSNFDGISVELEEFTRLDNLRITTFVEGVPAPEPHTCILALLGIGLGLGVRRRPVGRANR